MSRDESKRTFDQVVAFVAIMLLSPVFVMIAIAVKRDSRGPVLFRQTRSGTAGEPFQILKFRSMVVGADRLAANVSPAATLG